MQKYYRQIRFKNIIKLFVLLLQFNLAYSAKTITPVITTPIGTHLFKNSYVYTGANSASANNTYSLTFSSDATSHKALAITPINLNTTDRTATVLFDKKTFTYQKGSTTNPLTGKKISFLAVADKSPAVVIDGEKQVYLVHDINKLAYDLAPTSPSAALLDSAGSNIDAIIGLAGAKMSGTKHVFAAVTNNAGETFGASNSGICLIKSSVTVDDTRESIASKTTYSFNAVNSNKAFELLGSNSAIQITNAATINSNNIDMFWDEDLQCLYIAIDVASNSTSSSGARALLIGKINKTGSEDTLSFSEISPAAVFSGNNQIVGTATNNTSVAIKKVRTMKTTTNLDYLIVNGGNGARNTVGAKVYALPLVNNPSDTSTRGTLAKYDSTLSEKITNGFFNDRYFSTVASASGDLLTNSDTAAIVGSGDLPLSASNSITDMFTVDDTVFVSISDDFDGTNEPGIFCSKALFDSDSKIQSWTPWQRVGGTSEQIFGAGSIDNYGRFYYIPGTSSSNLTTVKVTESGLGANNGLLGGTTSDSTVGLVENFNHYSQNIFDFSKNTSGFSDFSLLVSTGYQNLKLIESGKVISSYYKNNTGDFSTSSASSSDGSFPTVTSSTKLASISGGALGNIGHITEATIATQTTGSNHWLIVGGTDGLAVLCDSSGDGWSSDISSLNDLPSGLSFKKVGDYSFIKKLVSDGTYLYVLTDKKLDRISLSNTIFANNSLSATTLALPGLNGFNSEVTFNDVIVSGKLALLATSQGLLRTGNSKNISTANNQEDVSWTETALPSSVGPVYKLFTLSRTTDLNNWVDLGNIYTLSSYRGYLESVVHRLTVNLDTNVDSNTIKNISDNFLENSNSYYISFHDYRDSLSLYNGSLFVTKSKDNLNDLALQRMPIKLITGSNKTFNTYKSNIYSIPLELDESNTHINQLTFNSASGSLLVSGDFGLRVCE